MAEQTKGNCYICGAELGKKAMQNHFLKQHQAEGDGQKCYLLKIEGKYDKRYWLYVDVPTNSALSALDSFLRKIWLECCGHLSAFRGAGFNELGKSRKLGTLPVGAKFLYEYDFGTTTELTITIMAETTRVKQRNIVRLLARNVPLEFLCATCGNPAEAIRCDHQYDSDNPFYCSHCIEQYEGEFILPITNSPRMGKCGFDGELDVYGFDPDYFSEAY